MPVSKSFLAHALELLSLLDGASARPMFGGYGLYADGGIFGLLDDDELFLKTDEECVEAFTKASCKQWVYPSPKGPMKTSSYRPPDDAMESAEAMLPWAKLALDASARARALKAEKEAAKGRRAAMNKKAAAPKKSAAKKKSVAKKPSAAAKKKTAARKL